MTATFHYEMLASPLHDVDHLNRSTSTTVGRLHELGGVGSPATRAADIPYLIVVGTGGTETQILDRWRVRQELVEGGEPAILVVHRTDNSLPAALEALARIHQDGGRGRIVMANRPMDLARAVADQVAYFELQRIRLGVIGEPSDWLVASSAPAETVRRRWGPTLVSLPTTTLSQVARSAAAEVAVELGRRWSGADERGSVAVDETRRAAQIHQPLVDLIEQHSLDAVTVRCFDLLGDAHTSGCVALAELNDMGIVAGCEGDLASALSMLWVRHLMGSASWMANPASVDPDTGSIVLAHCTVAPSLVADFELTTHFESGIGVGIAGRFSRQPVTLLRIGGLDLDQSWITDGELVASGDDPDLCRTQATVVVPQVDAAQLLQRPLGNHVVLVPGHHADRLRRWWRLYVAD